MHESAPSCPRCSRKTTIDEGDAIFFGFLLTLLALLFFATKFGWDWCGHLAVRLGGGFAFLFLIFGIAAGIKGCAEKQRNPPVPASVERSAL